MKRALPLLIGIILAAIIAACEPPQEMPWGQPAASIPGSSEEFHMIEQALQWGSIQQGRQSPPDTMFANTGRRIYVIGDIDGGFRPRSNPYDLHAYGRPDPNDPLANELQGVWAQPVKGLDGYSYAVQVDSESWDLADPVSFTQTFTDVCFEYQHENLHGRRCDFASQDQPVLFTALSLHNHDSKPVEGTLIFRAYFDLEDAWFTSLGERRGRGERLSANGERLVARSEVLPETWAVAVGGDRSPHEVRASTRRQNPTGELHYRFRLEPQGSQEWAFAMVIDSQGGPAAALHNLDAWLPQRAQMLAEKRSLYNTLAEKGPHLISPNPAFNDAFALAGANLQALEAETPALGRFFYAGLEMFPFWFSNDSAYSAPGLLASGMIDTVKNHIRTGARFAQEGAIPHQLSPAGHMVYPSNAQETAQWVSSVWDVYRWTGDRDFLQELYPTMLQGMFEHTLGRIDPDGDGYPSGPGMVEASGMGEEKLDTVAYTWAALNDLASIAAVLGDEASAEQARQAAHWIAARFDEDWWEESCGCYSMSLDSQNGRAHVPHWAIITPLEVGLASPQYAAKTLETVRSQYLNEWGIKHTIGTDERVWTLPVAVLSRAAYRSGDAQLGFEMLRKITMTLEHGSIGMFHELIPEGACFVQLWSAATFRRGVIEDLLGIRVNAGANTISIEPQLPADWNLVRLENLVVGAHHLDLEMNQTGIKVWSKTDSPPLTIASSLPVTMMDSP
jgi:hypothetical protein